MKLLLSVTITLKDYFPKNNSIHFENFICLFSLNNFNAKINLSNLNNNFIKHKIETTNSNLVYNLHMFDSTNNSLVGIYQLIINFEKIKNLNINDTLTQEVIAKLLIDQKTKRKIFDKITNMGDIFLVLSTEIKILDKKVYLTGNKQGSNKLKKYTNYENNENIKEFSLTPDTFKKKEIIRIMQNDREALKRMDNFAGKYSTNLKDYFRDETFSPSSTIKKFKSLNIGKMNALLNNNNNKNNELYNSNNQYFNNSCTVIMSPTYSNTNYNFKKDGNKNTNRKKKESKRKKATILNLREKKMEPSMFKNNEENILELSSQSKDYKNNSINFSKIAINNNSKKNKYNSLNNYHCKIKNIKSKIVIQKKNIKNLDEIGFCQRKNSQYNNKILVNLSGKNQIEKNSSEHKIKFKNKQNIVNPMDIGKINSEMINYDYKQNKNMNNIFLQTETTIKKLSERKKDLKRHILTDIDLKKIIKEKSNFIRETFNNNLYSQKIRGAFSPKLSLKIKLTDSVILSNEKSDKNTYRCNKRHSKRLLTPVSSQIKVVSFNKEDNLHKENEELRNKYFNLIGFYCLLTKKLKNACKNNIECIKKLQNIKEKYNYLNKYKYKIIQMNNYNDSKKIKFHVNIHFEEEKLLNKMINIKLKENCIYQNVIGNYDCEHNIQNKISIYISQKKEMLLNLIRNIVKFYGNISQIYNSDKAKKNIFKNLLNKYDIKEKIKTDLNYINYINKGNKIEDRVITEVDEEKENEEEDEEKIDNDTKLNNDLNKKEIDMINNRNIQNKFNINNINNIFNDNLEQEEIINNNNKIQEIQIYNFKNNINNNYEDNCDENLNYLINKILIEEFPQNYKTNLRFIHQNKNKYIFKDKIFYAFIENNNLVLKEEINNIIDNNKLTLNEIYQRYCLNGEKIEKPIFIYTKKIRQKYIKLKNNDIEISLEKQLKNENSTTIETEKKINTSNTN